MQALSLTRLNCVYDVTFA